MLSLYIMLVRIYVIIASPMAKPNTLSVETGEVLRLQFSDAVREIIRESLTDILVVTVRRP